jgi:chromosome segregation ATPase
MKFKARTSGVARVPAMAVVLAYFSVLLLVNSCTTSSHVTQQNCWDRIMAENRQMKKRIPLIERENDVLMKENIQYKLKLQQANASIGKLNTDLAASGEKYQRDMSSSEEKISNLEQKYSLLQSESAQKIAESSERFESLELKRQAEVKELNAQIADQKVAFNQEKNEFQQTATKKESLLSTRISELKQTVDMRESEISSLKHAYAEIQAKLGLMSNQLAEAQSARNQIESKLQSTQSINAELLRKPPGASGRPLQTPN